MAKKGDHDSRILCLWVQRGLPHLETNGTGTRVGSFSAFPSRCVHACLVKIHMIAEFCARHRHRAKGNNKHHMSDGRVLASPHQIIEVGRCFASTYGPSMFFTARTSSLLSFRALPLQRAFLHRLFHRHSEISPGRFPHHLLLRYHS